MFRIVGKFSIAALLAACLAGFTSSAVAAGGIEPIQRLGRCLGVGWGDGYHACASSGCRPGADLPPRSYASQFNNQQLAGSIVSGKIVSGCTFYDAFDAAGHCQCRGAGCETCRPPKGGGCFRGDCGRRARSCDGGCCDGGCDGCCDGVCAAEIDHTGRQVSEPGQPVALPVPQGAAESFSQVIQPGDTGRLGDTGIRLTAELAESQKRPIRPLPPRTKRRISIPDPIVRPDLPRPIRPKPPVAKFKSGGDQIEMPYTVTVAPALIKTPPATAATERQIIDKAINDVVLPEYVRASPSQTKPETSSAEKPKVEMVPQIATVPDWMVIRQPR